LAKWAKLKEKARQKKLMSEYIIMAHHLLCKEYGWIPIDEFRKIPFVTLMNLIQKINEDYERQQKELEKLKHKVR